MEQDPTETREAKTGGENRVQVWRNKLEVTWDSHHEESLRGAGHRILYNNLNWLVWYGQSKQDQQDILHLAIGVPDQQIVPIADYFITATSPLTSIKAKLLHLELSANDYRLDYVVEKGIPPTRLKAKHPLFCDEIVSEACNAFRFGEVEPTDPAGREKS